VRHFDGNFVVVVIGLVVVLRFQPGGFTLLACAEKDWKSQAEAEMLG
jgi:hypothetical protein